MALNSEILSRRLFPFGRVLLDSGTNGTVSFGSSGPDQTEYVSILIEIILLVLALILGAALHKFRVKLMGESGVALIFGLVVGLIFYLCNLSANYKSALSFNTDIFLLLFMPTIMFDAGYSVKPDLFFRNLASILLFAIVGTTVSTFVMGLLMWGFGQAGWCYQMSLLENLTFGAIISATDTVGVLSVFNGMSVQKNLYINVFGESILNDAVALVLYNTISSFLTDGTAVTAKSVLTAVGKFVGVCAGSTGLGIVIGLLVALLLRTDFLHSPTLETGMVLLFGWSSFLVAGAVDMSGIVSTFCFSLIVAKYVKPNLSGVAEIALYGILKVLTELFELFVFVYVGLSLFLESEAYNTWTYAVLCTLALAVSRALNIFPLAVLSNALRPAYHSIPFAHQFIMWWSGLRGAMAFALALEAEQNFGYAGSVMKTVTFYMIFLTVIVNGGTVGLLVEKMKLRETDEKPPSPGDDDEPLPEPNLFTRSRSVATKKLGKGLKYMDERHLQRIFVKPDKRSSQRSLTRSKSQLVVRRLSRIISKDLSIGSLDAQSAPPREIHEGEHEGEERVEIRVTSELSAISQQ